MTEVARPQPTETKLYIRSLNLNRGTEEDRARSPALDARLLYGPLSIDKIERSDDSTRVHFLIRLTLESDWLTIIAAFQGFQVYTGSHTDDQVRSQDFGTTIADGAASYIQEIVAYITGRSGINPLILPLTGGQFTLLREEQGEEK